MFPFSGQHRRRVEEWVTRHRARAFRIAWGWCGDPNLAEDLVQEACGKALRSRAQLREPERIEAWFLRIMHRAYLDHLKAPPRREQPVAEFDEAALGRSGGELVDELDPQALAMRRERGAQVRAAVAALPHSQRQVVVLVDLGGMSYVDCAGVLDVPVGTVMSRLHRARETLRERMGSGAGSGAARLRRVK